MVDDPTEQQTPLDASATHDATTDELIDSVKGLNEDQRAALEIAEAARETTPVAGGIGLDLFLGRFTTAAVEPFPCSSETDRRIGDVMVDKVSAFLAAHLDPEAVDETRSIPLEVIEGLKAIGVLRMKVPVEYGGLGFSQVNYNRVLMAIASYCGSTAVLVSAHQSIGVPQPLKMFGTDQQKQKFLTQVANGAISAFALTEVDVGSDPARMSTTAVLSDDGKHFILNGMKQWTTNGPIADLLVVMAQTAPKTVNGREKRQISAFIVETNSPGVESVHRCDFMGLRGIQNGLMEFSDVRVPVENLLWGEGLGLKLALKTLNTGRLTLPAACTGLAKQCLGMARVWAAERVQWGLPIGEHEAGAAKIADIGASTFAMEAVTWLTSHWADEQRDIRIEAAMAKLFCSETAWRLVDETLQLRGGRGYERARSLQARGERPYPIERMLRDTRINTIIEGTSDIMRLFLAREALDPHLKRAAAILSRKTPLTTKFKAGLGLLGHYARWCPGQVLKRMWTPRYGQYGRLAKHMRFVDRTSHRLASRLVGAMMRHRAKLERQQILLGHLMDIGTELFAMTACCAYAKSGAISVHGSDPAGLADVFCRMARARINEHFLALGRGGLSRRMRRLSKRVLDGKCRWLESGIVAMAEMPVADAPATQRNGAIERSFSPSSTPTDEEPARR